LTLSVGREKGHSACRKKPVFQAPYRFAVEGDPAGKMSPINKNESDGGGGRCGGGGGSSSSSSSTVVVVYSINICSDCTPF